MKTFLAATVAALALGLAAPAFAEPVKIGMITTLSGGGAGLGVDARDGFDLAIKLAGNSIGEFSPTLEWIRRLTREPIVLGVIGCYLAAFVTYTTLLKYAPVGPAYAAVHGHIVTVLIVSFWLFGETLSPMQVAGCASIVAGIDHSS